MIRNIRSIGISLNYSNMGFEIGSNDSYCLIAWPCVAACYLKGQWLRVLFLVFCASTPYVSFPNFEAKTIANFSFSSEARFCI